MSINVDLDLIEETAEGYMSYHSWHRGKSGPESKKTDECWKIQYGGLRACSRCRYPGKAGCTGEFIRLTGHNEMGNKVPLIGRDQQGMFPEIVKYIAINQKIERIEWELLLDEFNRRARLIIEEKAEPAFRCDNCNKDFWFSPIFTSVVHERCDDEGEGTEFMYCSENCRDYNEEDYSFCDLCSRELRYDQFIYDEAMGDPVCRKCAKEEALSEGTSEAYFMNEILPTDLDLGDRSDEFKTIKQFDGIDIPGDFPLDAFCQIMLNLRKRGVVLVDRNDTDSDNKHGNVSVYINPFSKNKIRKDRRYRTV
jgi:hypothetical protein